MKKYSTGLELILNACEGCLQIVVTDDEEPLCFQEWFAPRRATEILTPALRDICDSLKIDPRSFRRVGCFAGPGSFTGVRLVLTTAAALRRSSNAQLASLDYLQALATTAAIERDLLYPTTIFVLTGARRDQVHFREYTSYGPQIPAQPKTNDGALLSTTAALAVIDDCPCYACGGALKLYPNVFAQAGPDATLLPNIERPSLAALRLLARHGDYFPKDVEPVYLRECDAVENFVKTARKRGEDAEELLTVLASLLARDPREN